MISSGIGPRRLCIFLKQGENKERQTNDRSNRHKFLPADF